MVAIMLLQARLPFFEGEGHRLPYRQEPGGESYYGLTLMVPFLMPAMALSAAVLASSGSL